MADYRILLADEGIFLEDCMQIRKLLSYWCLVIAWILVGSVALTRTGRYVAVSLMDLAAALDRARHEKSTSLVSVDALSTFAQLQKITVVYAVIGIVGSFLAAWLLYRYVVHGCAELSQGARRFGQGDLDYRIAYSANNELGEVATAFNAMATKLSEAQQELKRQQELAESLLLNVLPKEVAQELKQKGAVDPRYHDDVTIVFTDFQGFTRSSESIAAGDLVAALHDHFTAFDRITEQYGLEKLKTIGDSYMCVAGLTEKRASHAVDALLTAFGILDEVLRRQQGTNLSWSIRIGVHTGPVISGVVGIRKFAYDIWGESVNFASRMESTGSPNRINLSSSTYLKVKDFFACEARGKVLTKEARDYEMYFATGILPALRESNVEAAFASRYRSYFHRDLPGLPKGLLSAS